MAQAEAWRMAERLRAVELAILGDALGAPKLDGHG